MCNFYRPSSIKSRCSAYGCGIKLIEGGTLSRIDSGTVRTLICRMRSRRRSWLESDGRHNLEMDLALVTVDHWTISLKSSVDKAQDACISALGQPSIG